MENGVRPNEGELQFLTLSYNKFYDLFEEIMTSSFWENESFYRFNKINNVFSIYSELLNYEPIKIVIELTKRQRPPMEAEIASEVFKFIRNTLAHFPFFDSWNDVYVNKEIVNWFRTGMTIDRFLRKYEGKSEVKYRFWNSKNSTMTYLSIKFPQSYSRGESVYLKDIIEEIEGVQFSLILMKQILDTQVLEINE